jgi:hypothetical protein
MALTFAVVATPAAVGGGWAIRAMAKAPAIERIDMLGAKLPG